MNRYLPIKIDTCSHEYMIDLCGNTWTDSGLPVSNITKWKLNDKPVVFRLHICELMKAGDKEGNTEFKNYLNTATYEQVGQDSVSAIIHREIKGCARKASAVKHATRNVEWLRAGLAELIPAMLEDSLYKTEQAMYNMSTDKVLGVLK